MDGMATFTMVASTMIMEMPRLSAMRVSQRARPRFTRYILCVRN